MALQINNKQGIFEIDGNIIGTNVTSVNHHFDHLLSTTDYIVISVDQVQKIDSSGVRMLTKLYQKAKKLNKVFKIISRDNHTIKKAFGLNSFIIRKNA